MKPVLPSVWLDRAIAAPSCILIRLELRVESGLAAWTILPKAALQNSQNGSASFRMWRVCSLPDRMMDDICIRGICPSLEDRMMVVTWVLDMDTPCPSLKRFVLVCENRSCKSERWAKPSPQDVVAGLKLRTTHGAYQAGSSSWLPITPFRHSVLHEHSSPLVCTRQNEKHFVTPAKFQHPTVCPT